MKLYADPITINCRKVLAGFALMGVRFENERVDYYAQGHKAPQYLAINPNGTLPALTDSGLVLWESNAILQYAAEAIAAEQFYPHDPKLRADIHRWQFWETGLWYPSCYIYLVENVAKPLQKAEPDHVALEKEEPNWHRLAGILDNRLSDHKWLCGDTITIADVSVAASIHLPRLQKLPLESHPNVERWFNQVQALPCWKESDPAIRLGLA